MNFILAIAIILFLAICAWFFWRKLKSTSTSPTPTSTSLESLEPTDTLSKKNGRETPQPVSETAIPSQAEKRQEKPQTLPGRDLSIDEQIIERHPPPLSSDRPIPSSEPNKIERAPESISKESREEVSESLISHSSVTNGDRDLAPIDSDNTQSVDDKYKPGDSEPASQVIEVSGPSIEPLDKDKITPHQPSGEPSTGDSKQKSIKSDLETPPDSVELSDSYKHGEIEFTAITGKTSLMDNRLTDRVDLELTSDEPQAPLPEQRKTAPNGKGKSQQILAQPKQEISSGTPKKSTQETLEPIIAETKSGGSEDSGTIEPEDDLSSDAVLEHPKKEDLRGKSAPTRKKRVEKRPPPKYQPSIRTPEATKRNRVKQRSETEGSRERSFQMHVHVVLGRRNRCQVSLIPSRAPDLEEEIDVNGPNGEEIWSACQDEWYSDISADNISFLLEKGGTWEVRKIDETKLRWVLSIREIYVLAPSSTISAYVSTTRLILYEDHIVLCIKRQEELVRKALSEAGCSNPKVISGDNGVPKGWILFHSVCPTCPVEHDEAAGIFNNLRPVHDLEIILQGGIRLTYTTWINGHPPKIRIRGSKDDNIQVMIDGEVASAGADGMYTAKGWDSQGTHNVFCGGVTQTYEMSNGLQQWEHFEAYNYSPSLQKTTEKSVTICGPVVAAIDEICEAVLTPTINARLLGAIPGQISYFPRQDNTRTPEYLAFADFPIVWTLPWNPFQCDRHTSYVKLIRPRKVGSIQNYTGSRDNILRWSYAILDSSRRRLRIEPNTDESTKLWVEYKKVARRLWKKLK